MTARLRRTSSLGVSQRGQWGLLSRSCKCKSCKHPDTASFHRQMVLLLPVRVLEAARDIFGVYGAPRPVAVLSGNLHAGQSTCARTHMADL